MHTIILLMLINLSRQELANEQPLVENYQIEQVAQARAQYLYENNLFSHDKWQDSFQNIPCYWEGENLAKDFTNVLAEHQALMASPKHRYNILLAKFNEVGIGIYGNITVELFCQK